MLINYWREKENEYGDDMNVIIIRCKKNWFSKCCGNEYR